MDLYVLRLVNNPEFYLPLTLIIVFSICFHELGHAWIALKQGDPTARDNGHLSLNPMVQMGPFSLILMALCGIAYGSVPVNPRNFKSKWSDLYVSIAGPICNIIVFLVLGFLSVLLPKLFANSLNIAELELLRDIFVVGALMNMALFILNMIPVPPLDGWSVWPYVFPGLRKVSPETESMLSWGVIFIFVFMAGPIFAVSGKITSLYINLFSFIQ